MLLLSQILNLHHIELVFTHAFQIKFKFLVLIHHLFFFIGQFFTLLYVLLIALTKLVFPRVDQVTFSGRCCHGSLGLSWLLVRRLFILFLLRNCTCTIANWLAAALLLDYDLLNPALGRLVGGHASCARIKSVLGIWLWRRLLKRCGRRNLVENDGTRGGSIRRCLVGSRWVWLQRRLWLICTDDIGLVGIGVGLFRDLVTRND